MNESLRPPTTGGAEAAVPTAPSVEVSEASEPDGQRRGGAGDEVTPATQEVRFATAMTGGVSLAVWMGGVARELNLLDQASRRREGVRTAAALNSWDERVCDLYARLLGLMDQVVRIDVLSGTSAGGINAALLGLCHARGVDLGGLRDLWLRVGAFDTLLRNPTEARPDSLLQGDGVLLAQLNKAIGQLAGLSRANVGEEPVATETVVFITTALLSGETSRFTDSYGTVVPDVEHLAVMTFPTAALCSPSGSDLDALALAARASASFPGAFEPAFIPFLSPVDGSDRPRPAMKRYANISRPHWAADGGLLANRPIRQLLETIFERRADEREVRRVLLYIVPDPGGTPDPAATPGDVADIRKPHTLGEALIADVGASLNQSIASDLEAIRTQNERVDAVRNTRLRLAELGLLLGPGQSIATSGSRDDFVRRVSEELAGLVVSRLMREISSRPEKELPASWAASVQPGTPIEADCRRLARDRIVAPWNLDAALSGDYVAIGALGRSAYDAAQATILTMIRVAYVLSNRQQRQDLARLGRRVHDAFIPIDTEDLDEQVRLAVDEPDGRSLPHLAADLAEEYALQRGRGTSIGLDGTPHESHATVDGRGADLSRAWGVLADLIEEATPILDALGPPESIDDVPTIEAGRRPSRQLRRARARYELATYLAFLGSSPNGIASRLLALHVAERNMVPAFGVVDQAVELIQLSANTRTLLSERQRAKDKLTGMQLHHFGAFYKSSWRANDWMWGRLDGAGWLIHALLDPRRVLAVVESYGQENRAQSFFDQLHDLITDDGGGAPSETTKRAILDELAYLDDEDASVPLSLPTTSLWLASRWQACITAAELPVVAEEALSTPTRNRQDWASQVLGEAGVSHAAVAASRRAVAKVTSGRRARKERASIQGETRPIDEKKQSERQRIILSPADEARWAAHLRACPVPEETFAEERGEPLLTQTVAKATAVGTAALTSLRQPPASVSPLFAAARTATLTGYRMVNATDARPKALTGLGVLAMLVGGFMAVQQSTLLGLSGTLIALAGLLVAVLGVWGIGARALRAVAGLLLIAALVVLCLPWTRDALYGTGRPDERGWVVDTVIPWLRNSWWAGLLVLAVIVLLGTIPGLVGTTFGRRKKLTSGA